MDFFIVKRTITILALHSLCSCAGPSTPFGAESLFTKLTNSSSRTIASAVKKKDIIKISSFPKSKLFHDNFNLTFTVENPKGLREPFQYNILYNGQIVHRWLKTESLEFNKEHTKAKVIFKNLALNPIKKHDITFLYYDKENHAPLYYELEEPECSFTNQNRIKHLKPFDKKNYLIKQMNSIAKKHLINPILLASLVAQESSFNPKAVSIARAVGLTQVTPIADKDIRSLDPSFQSYPNLEKLSYIDLKYKIFRGIINEKNDWRLNELKSLQGGSLYLSQLENYWGNQSNQKFLNTNLDNVKKTDIILASYNSGAYRVKRNIIRHKNKWLYSKELGEARKYVNNIKSYCNHFED